MRDGTPDRLRRPGRHRCGGHKLCAGPPRKTGTALLPALRAMSRVDQRRPGGGPALAPSHGAQRAGKPLAVKKSIDDSDICVFRAAAKLASTS
jgi:hypothetical protein